MYLKELNILCLNKFYVNKITLTDFNPIQDGEGGKKTPLTVFPL